MVYIISLQIHKNKIPCERLLKEFQYEIFCKFFVVLKGRLYTSECTTNYVKIKRCLCPFHFLLLFTKVAFVVINYNSIFELNLSHSFSSNFLSLFCYHFCHQRRIENHKIVSLSPLFMLH